MSRVVVEDFYSLLCGAEETAALNFLSEEVKWNAAHPINDLIGKKEFLDAFWQPIKAALSNIERKPFIIIDDEYEGRQWVASTGYFVGTFDNDLFGIPATKRALYLRYSELICVEQDKITEAYIIPDFLDAMVQADVYPIRKSLGKSDIVLPPTTMDGLSAFGDGTETQKLVSAMLTELSTYDGASLESMELGKYWHPEFMWYGPAGIGTTRGIKGFRKQHQGPFLKAFPDRSIDRSECYVGIGNYAAIGGWPHMSATHTGEGWLGLAPTGREISLRVFDFWRREDDMLMENWVSIDIIHILKQLGLDVFEQIKLLSK